MEASLTPLLIRCDPRLPGIWPKLAHYLRNAIFASGCERDWNIDDVFNLCAVGRCHLWALVHGEEIFGACVTQISQYPQRAVMDVLLLGTEPNTEDLWGPLVEQMKAIARSMGVSALSGTGRDGWYRKINASRHKIVFELDL